MSTAQGGSLLIAGFETWPTHPTLGTYTIASDEFGLGDPTALTRAIEQVSLDGERITGRRHGNRLLNLLVVIRASTRQGLDFASGQLEMAVNANTWQVQWTPPHLSTESALPVVYDAYRAVTVIDYDVENLDPSYVEGAKFVRAIKIEAPAFPFGKTPVPVTITGSTGITQLMTFESAPTGTQLGWYLGADRTSLPHTLVGSGGLDSSTHTQGSNSWRAQESGAAAGNYVHLEMNEISTLGLLSGAPVDLSAAGRVLIDVKMGNVGGSPIPFTMSFYDGTTTAYSTISQGPTGAWDTLSFPVPSGINKTHVMSIGLYIGSVFYAGGPAPIAWLDNLRFSPASSSLVTVTNGGSYRFAGVPGTARANVALLAQAASGQTFGALVAHSAPPEARPDYTPLVPLAPSTAPPYTVSMPNYQGSASYQRYDGTYAIWLGGVTLNGSGARTITVTFTEASIGSVSVSRSITPATDLHSGLLWIGIVDLPLVAAPDGSTLLTNGSGSVTLTVTINSGNTADRFSDLLVLDVRGPTVIFTDGRTNALVAVDEPTATAGIGEVYQGNGTAAMFACPDVALVSGGPFTFEPGDNIAVFYSPQGAPTVTATFYPRWLSTRSA